mmetsp:Transcript_3100/g.5458  ORF Transcript_3100/g.5458 Transcript_3100/m.5458 type:complete len:285 (+) Transcript_3100:1494-2348(+)
MTTLHESGGGLQTTLDHNHLASRPILRLCGRCHCRLGLFLLQEVVRCNSARNVAMQAKLLDEIVEVPLCSRFMLTAPWHVLVPIRKEGERKLREGGAVVPGEHLDRCLEVLQCLDVVLLRLCKFSRLLFADLRSLSQGLFVSSNVLLKRLDGGAELAALGRVRIYRRFQFGNLGLCSFNFLRLLVITIVAPAHELFMQRFIIAHLLRQSCTHLLQQVYNARYWSGYCTVESLSPGLQQRSLLLLAHKAALLQALMFHCSSSRCNKASETEQPAHRCDFRTSITW